MFISIKAENCKSMKVQTSDPETTTATILSEIGIRHVELTTGHTTLLRPCNNVVCPLVTLQPIF